MAKVPALLRISRRPAVVVALSVCVLSAATSVAGQSGGKDSLKCESRKDKIALESGIERGHSLLSSAFDAMRRDCKALGKLRKLAQALRASHAPEKQERRDTQCRALGVHQGIAAALAEFEAGCKRRK